MYEKIYAQSRWNGITPIHYNPSFAGNTGGQRVIMFSGYTSSKGGEKVSRNNDVNVFYKRNISISTVSYDNFIPKIASGIGFFATYNNGEAKTFWGEYKGAALYVGLVVSPKISINGKYTIAPSAEVTYTHSDSYVILNGRSDSRNFISDNIYINIGLLFNSKDFYIGLTNGGNYYGYGTWNLQTGYTYQRSKEAKASYTMQALINFPGSSAVSNFFSNLSLTYKYNKLILGVTTTDNFVKLISGNAAQNAIYTGVGYQSKKLKIFYSQDLTNVNYVYSGELSCRIFIPDKNKAFNSIYN